MRKMQKPVDISWQENTESNMFRLRGKSRHTPRKERKECSKEITKEKVVSWVNEQNKLGPQTPFKDWPTDLFKKPYQEIIEWILERYNSTEDEMEYYVCMIFLHETIPDDQLCTPFKDRRKINGPTSLTIKQNWSKLAHNHHKTTLKLSRKKRGRKETKKDTK